MSNEYDFLYRTGPIGKAKPLATELAPFPTITLAQGRHAPDGGWWRAHGSGVATFAIVAVFVCGAVFGLIKIMGPPPLDERPMNIVPADSSSPQPSDEPEPVPTVTKTVPGPVVTVERPGPTTTVRVPVPGPTKTVPGPRVTVKVPIPEPEVTS